MDSGPFRTSRPAERSATRARTETAYEPAGEVAPASPRAQSAANQPQPPRRKKSAKKLWWTIAGILIAGALIALGWFFITKQGVTAAIDSGKYQAVFLSNSQVYFGKLTVIDKDYLRLTDIYYLQTEETGSETESQNPQDSSASDQNVKLIKLGNEIHGPEDEMIIVRDQLLFYENLKTDSNVAQTIAKYKAGNN